MINSIFAAPDLQNKEKVAKCSEACTFDYTPVCGGPAGSTNQKEMKSFGNECVMKKYNCEKGESKSNLTPFSN